MQTVAAATITTAVSGAIQAAGAAIRTATPIAVRAEAAPAGATAQAETAGLTIRAVAAAAAATTRKIINCLYF